jgi:hypothetical protein
MRVSSSWHMIAIISLVIISTVTAIGLISLDTTVKHRPFLDPDGRTRIFHGFNVVYKGAPWYVYLYRIDVYMSVYDRFPLTDHFDPKLSLSAEDMDNMKAWYDRTSFFDHTLVY